MGSERRNPPLRWSWVLGAANASGCAAEFDGLTCIPRPVTKAIAPGIRAQCRRAVAQQIDRPEGCARTDRLIDNPGRFGRRRRVGRSCTKFQPSGSRRRHDASIIYAYVIDCQIGNSISPARGRATIDRESHLTDAYRGPMYGARLRWRVRLALAGRGIAYSASAQIRAHQRALDELLNHERGFFPFHNRLV